MRGMLIDNDSLSPTKFRIPMYTGYVFSVTYYSELHIAKTLANNESFEQVKSFVLYSVHTTYLIFVGEYELYSIYHFA